MNRWRVLLLSEMFRRLYNPAVVAASYRTRVLHSEDHLLAVQNSKLGSAGGHSWIVYALQLRSSRGPSRAAGSVEGADDTDKAPGKPDRSRPMTRATPTASKGMRALHVCRSPVARALTRMLTCACCASLGRFCYTLRDYGAEFFYPEACLAVLVAGQRSQASVGARGAVNPLRIYRSRIAAVSQS